MQNIFDFYKNHKNAEKEITTKIEEIKSILLMIYRQRNQIVHNARYDKTLIEYNIAQIKSAEIRDSFHIIDHHLCMDVTYHCFKVTVK